MLILSWEIQSIFRLRCIHWLIIMLISRMFCRRDRRQFDTHNLFSTCVWIDIWSTREHCLVYPDKISHYQKWFLINTFNFILQLIEPFLHSLSLNHTCNNFPIGIFCTFQKFNKTSLLFVPKKYDSEKVLHGECYLVLQLIYRPKPKNEYIY